MIVVNLSPYVAITTFTKFSPPEFSCYTVFQRVSREERPAAQMSLRTYTFGEEMTEVDFSMATGRSKVDLQPETSRKDEEKMQFAKEM